MLLTIIQRVRGNNYKGYYFTVDGRVGAKIVDIDESYYIELFETDSQR